jgi:Ca2+-binding EF-hand superfamily protein
VSLTMGGCRQIVTRSTSNLTPAQLEEFETVFRHFDRDQTNTLGLDEFSAALSGLGIVFSVRPWGSKQKRL